MATLHLLFNVLYNLGERIVNKIFLHNKSQKILKEIYQDKLFLNNTKIFY
jgi:hypothetical protein